jgi:hypothetical protein
MTINNPYAHHTAPATSRATARLTSGDRIDT